MQGTEQWYVPEWGIIRGKVMMWHSFPSEKEARDFASTNKYYGAPQKSGLCPHCRDALPPVGQCFCRSTWSGGNG